VAPCLRALAMSENMTEKNKTPKIALRYLMMTLVCGPVSSQIPTLRIKAANRS
jgi:hypothetical protein